MLLDRVTQRPPKFTCLLDQPHRAYTLNNGFYIILEPLLFFFLLKLKTRQLSINPQCCLNISRLFSIMLSVAAILKSALVLKLP